MNELVNRIQTGGKILKNINFFWFLFIFVFSCSMKVGFGKGLDGLTGTGERKSGGRRAGKGAGWATWRDIVPRQ
jgi:hypothetical protein